MSSLRKISLLLTVLINFVLVFIVSSCASQDTGRESVQSEKMYLFPCSSRIETLDPAKISNMSEESIASEIFDSLVSVTNDFQIVPEIADRWEYDVDRLLYTFYLKKGIRFHNGRELTAADVKYSFSRLVDPTIQSGRRNWARWIKGTDKYYDGEADEVEGLRVIDDYTIEIELFRTYTPFLSLLTTTAFSIIPEPEIQDNPDDISKKPVGSGPFRYVGVQDDGSVKLSAFKKYYSGEPLLDSILYRVLNDPAQMIKAFKNSELHHVWVFPELAEKILADETIPGQIVNYPVNAIYHYAFNLDKKQFGGSKEQKRLLRQAINHAIDREKICREIFRGRCTPSNSVIPFGICGYENPLSKRMGFSFNVDKALETLDLAGYPDGEGVGKVSLYTTYESPNIEIAEIVQNNLADIGLDVEIVAKDKKNYLEAVWKGDPELFSYEYYMAHPDLDDLISMFHSDNAYGGKNFSRMTRDNIDSIIDETRQSPDPDIRTETIIELENQLLFDAPWVFMFQLRNAILIQPEVGFLKEQLSQLDFRESISHVRMEKVDLVIHDEEE